jgi:hypothetical protein
MNAFPHFAIPRTSALCPAHKCQSALYTVRARVQMWSPANTPGEHVSEPNQQPRLIPTTCDCLPATFLRALYIKCAFPFPTHTCSCCIRPSDVPSMFLLPVVMILMFLLCFCLCAHTCVFLLCCASDVIVLLLGEFLTHIVPG